jgi:hypothetical protein
MSLQQQATSPQVREGDFGREVLDWLPNSHVLFSYGGNYQFHTVSLPSMGEVVFCTVCATFGFFHVNDFLHLALFITEEEGGDFWQGITTSPSVFFRWLPTLACQAEQ